ncbi:unnamed protein product [Orchesella dallaii]|uniref:Uncharacterized protein n=1 Tax=Orchesella dallaii TaxID=48710 RepID=A0ABP1RQZ6_9HEXA
MERFGQVYIRTKSVDSPNEFVLVPSARFSNLNHKWYNSKGDVHSEYHQYRGTKFSLLFKSDQYDKNGQLVHFEGNIHLPYGLGEVSTQDFEGVDAALKEDIEIIRRLNLISDDYTDLTKYHKIELPSFTPACYPGTKLSDSKLQRINNIALFAFDDDMEKLTHLKLKQFDEFMNAAYKAMNLHDHSIETTTPTTHEIPESLLKYVKVIQFFENELSIAENGSNRGKYVREALLDCIHSICMETSREWNDEGNGVYRKVQKELRLTVSGVVIYLEVSLFDANIQIKAQIRNTFLFKWFLRILTEYVAWANDVISFRKESEAGRATCNTVYLLHYHKGLPLANAMQEVLDKTKIRCTLLIETGRMLCELYEDDENVHRFVEMAKGLAYGVVQCHSITDRYHKNFLFDCVVE